jgi:Ca2+-dependent lipid-binding protein
VGYMSVRLQDMLDAKVEAGRDWWPLSGCKSGRIRLGVEWKPLHMAGSLQGADSYIPPIGVVRLHLQKATDVKCVFTTGCFFFVLKDDFSRNVEAALGGKVMWAD